MANLVPTRWRNAFDRLQEDFDRTFDRWLPARGRRNGDDLTPALWSETVPAVDMEEDENEIRVTAELPGLKKDDFSVEVLDNRLQIRGEKKAERETKEENYYYCERSYGSFSRSIPLPIEVDADKVDATYRDGVLKIRLPKTESAKRKRIDIKVS